MQGNSSKVAVTSDSASMGGLVGRSKYSTIEDAYSEAAVYGGNFGVVGGVVGGQLDGRISRMYSKGSIYRSSDSSTGKVVGFTGFSSIATVFGTIEHAYGISDTSPIQAIGKIESGMGYITITDVKLLLPQQLLIPSSFHTWDFTNVWQFNFGEWPTLR